MPAGGSRTTATVSCPNCGVSLTENSMRFHRQVCGTSQKPQCRHCSRRFDADGIAHHEAACGEAQAKPPRPPSPRQAFSARSTTTSAVPVSSSSSFVGNASGAQRPAAATPITSTRGSMPPEPHGKQTAAEAPQGIGRGEEGGEQVPGRDSQTRREVMRRGLDQLREEIYGTPANAVPHNYAPPAESEARPEEASARWETEESRKRRPAPRIVRQPDSEDDEGADGHWRSSTVSGRGTYHRIPRDASTRQRSPDGLSSTTPASNPPMPVAAATSVATEDRLHRLEAALDGVQRQLTTLGETQTQLLQAVRDVSVRQDEHQREVSERLRSSGSIATMSELRTELHGVGRHVDELRADVQTLRQHQQQYVVKQDRQADSLPELQAVRAELEEERSVRTKEAEALRHSVDAYQTQTANALQDLQQQHLEAEHKRESAVDGAVAELRADAASNGKAIKELWVEVDRQKGIAKRDAKLIGDDFDGLQAELQQLTSAVDRDRQRIDAAIARGLREPGSTPRARGRIAHSTVGNTSTYAATAGTTTTPQHSRRRPSSTSRRSAVLLESISPVRGEDDGGDRRDRRPMMSLMGHSSEDDMDNDGAWTAGTATDAEERKVWPLMSRARNVPVAPPTTNGTAPHKWNSVAGGTDRDHSAAAAVTESIAARAVAHQTPQVRVAGYSTSRSSSATSSVLPSSHQTHQHRAPAVAHVSLAAASGRRH